MVPYQWRMTYCCEAAYRQSVPWYNMCVNDNVKGYCHASLVTQNTLPLWKLADHYLKVSGDTHLLSGILQSQKGM